LFDKYLPHSISSTVVAATELSRGEAMVKYMGVPTVIILGQIGLTVTTLVDLKYICPKF